MVVQYCRVSILCPIQCQPSAVWFSFQLEQHQILLPERKVAGSNRRPNHKPASKKNWLGHTECVLNMSHWDNRIFGQ